MATLIGGIENRACLKSGKIKPINKPYSLPQIKPHSKTGICIGSNIVPISGICPVTKGKTSPSAKKNALRVIFFICLFIS